MLFFELIQIAVGERASLSRTPTEEEWQEAYQIATKQTLVGMSFSAVEIINKDDNTMMPPMSLFYQWLGDTLQIESRNKELNYASSQLYRIFNNSGLRCSVLKGQGIASLYPNPQRRQSGAFVHGQGRYMAA